MYFTAIFLSWSLLLFYEFSSVSFVLNCQHLQQSIESYKNVTIQIKKLPKFACKYPFFLLSKITDLSLSIAMLLLSSFTY